MLALERRNNYYLGNEQIAVIYSFAKKDMQVYSCKKECLHKYMGRYNIHPLTTSLVSLFLEKNSASYMPIINIELTKGCNHACVHCYNEAGTKVDFLRLKDFKRIIEKIKETYSCFQLRLSGGEPTLHPDIVSICDFVMKCTQEPAHTIITNGTMPTMQFHKLLATGIQMQISVYGYEYSTYQNFTKGNKLTYFNLLNNLNSIEQQEKSQIELIYYYSSITQKDISAFEDFVKKNNINYRYSKIMPLGRASSSPRRWLMSGDDENIVQSKSFKNPIFRDRLCESNRINICFDGSITPCPFWSGNSKYVMGNILYEDLIDIVNGKKFVGYRSASVDDVEGCNTCPMRYLCTGGCRAIIEYSNDWALQKPIYCGLDKLVNKLDMEMHTVKMPYPGQFVLY